MSQSEVHVVPGWLTAVGAGLARAGGPPPASVGGLPQRWHGAPAWLLDRPVWLDPNGYTEPEDGVQVQSGAYEAFSGVRPTSTITEPVPGLWAVAPRLEGAGCPDNLVPCWQWNLVGRVAYDEASNIAEPVATPAPTSSPTLEPSPTRADPLPTAPTPSPQPAAVTHECSGPPLPPGETHPPGSLPTVVDYTGLVTLCVVTDVLAAELDGAISVADTQNGANAVQVIWADGACDADIVFSFERLGDAYLLSGDRPETCDTDDGGTFVDIRFSERVSAGDIRVTLDEEPVALTTAPPNPDNACPAAEVRGTVVGHRESGVGLRMDDGRVLAVMWPHGYTAKRSADGLVLYRPDGSVAARDGDYLLTGGGHYETYIYACSEGDVAEPVAIWTAQTWCGLEAIASGYLVPHADSGLGIRYVDVGPVTSAVVWPPGYTARREHSTIVLVGPDGVIRATEGDLVTFGGGESPNGSHILACAEVTTGRSP
jgi:hypothetical protein